MKKIIFGLCVFALSIPQVQAQTQQVRVEVTSNAPTGGVAITPLWVGFHNGSFDSYNGGLSSQEGLERQWNTSTDSARRIDVCDFQH